MARASSRSRLFPHIEEGGVYAGNETNLAYEQGHSTGTKILAGKLVVPGEQENKYRVEIGPADFRGVEYVGATNQSLNYTSASRYTFISPHASTQEGDLMLLFQATDREVGDAGDVVPSGGWELISSVGGDSIGIWAKRYGPSEPTSYGIHLAHPFTSVINVNQSLITLRNADLLRAATANIGNASGGPNTTGSPPSILDDIPAGSMSLISCKWSHTASGDTTTVTPPTGYTEIKDFVHSTSATSSQGLAVAYKSLQTSTNVDPGDFTLSNSRDWNCFHLIVHPITDGIRGWTGAPGSETFILNEDGDQMVKYIHGDVEIQGNLRAKKPMLILQLPADQTISHNTATSIDAYQPTWDDDNFWDDVSNCIDFTGKRGIWRILFQTLWEPDSTGRRKAGIKVGTSFLGATEVATGNHQAPPAGNGTATAEHYFILADDDSYRKAWFEVVQTSGGNLNLLADGTFIICEYVRELD